MEEELFAAFDDFGCGERLTRFESAEAVLGEVVFQSLTGRLKTCRTSEPSIG